GHGDRNAVVERSVNRNLVALDELRDLRKPRSPQHGKTERAEEQVVEHEARFARYDRLEFVFAAEVIFILYEEENEYRGNNGEESGEPIPDRRLRKCVYGTDDAAASQERP